jgi:hypothetical protein
MRLDPNPLFRRIIMPWYDSPPMCWGLLAAMVVIILFSVAGITVAFEDQGYRRHLWVPWTLFILCTVVGCSVAFRLMRRHYQQRDPDT